MRDEAIPNSVPEISTNRTLEKASAFSAAFWMSISKSISSFLYTLCRSVFPLFESGWLARTPGWLDLRHGYLAGYRVYREVGLELGRLTEGEKDCLTNGLTI